MNLDDPGERLLVGEADVVEEAAAQEGVRQLLLVVRGDDDDRPVPGADRLAGLVDEEFHPVEFLQQVVRELDVGLVDLVDQQHQPAVGGERPPERAGADVVADVVHARVAELAVAQPADRVVFVEALGGLGRRLDVPFDQRQAERGGDLAGELGLAGAGLALDEERPLQRDRGVDRHRQVGRRDVVRRAFEFHRRTRAAMLARAT